MQRSLALHQITAMEAGPVELVGIAAEIGCDGICVFTHSPVKSVPGRKSIFEFPMVTPDSAPELISRLRGSGVAVTNVEFFPITEGVNLEDYRPGLALGGQLGARLAVTHVHDTQEARAVDTLGRLCDMAAHYGLSLGLEFMGLTPGCNSAARAEWFVEQVARPNIGIGVDALHLARTGGTPADIIALPAHVFAYSQICDGRGLHRSSDYLGEALDRLMPGEGDFPLKSMIEALPRAIALDVEVPSPTLRDKGMRAIDRARRAVERARALIQQAEPSR